MSTLAHACPICRVAIARGTTVCRTCGVRISAPARTPESDPHPPVWITTENYHPLEACARRHRAHATPVGDFLLGELSRAVVCAPEWIAPDVVTMNSRVQFAVGEDARPETRLLVFPDRHEPTGHTLSVLSPLGAALLGLAAGSGMTVKDRQGAPLSVRVERVVYQPEAMRRQQLPAA